MPLCALRWSQVEVALWGDTAGAFRPVQNSAQRRARREERLSPTKAERGEGAPARPLVSVIVPTTGSRRLFQSLLWQCFHQQSYEPREIVVIDTSEDGPSEFWVGKAAKDPRVVYKHFQVPDKAWSIGLKRNLACYYAVGRVIAHFDDADIYASTYLETMVQSLQDPKVAFSKVRWQQAQEVNATMLEGLGITVDGRPPKQQDLCQDVAYLRSLREGFGAAMAKLSCWHTFSFRSRQWGFFDACQDMKEYDVESQLYGWGFSMVYLRDVWAYCPFLHMNLGEDYDFARSLRKLGLPVVLVPDNDGICAHSHHAANTAGGMECVSRGYNTFVMYSPLALLAPMYEQAARQIHPAQERDAAGKEQERPRRTRLASANS